ncbi:MAG: hypothetical protein K0Q51_1449 [Rickettsiaceae bacterium]|jgi:Skp family chaperone for outer membrane proteins|nr:hypothetical protein [Rickettsiaceae bacterium]
MKDKIVSLATRHPTLSYGNKGNFATVRYMYKAQNRFMYERTYNTLKNYIPPETKVNLNDALHRELLVTASTARDLVKDTMQDVTGKIDAEVIRKINDRQTRVYSEKPTLHSDKYGEYMINQLEKKPIELSLIELILKAFKPGGKDIVDSEVNAFADAMVEIQNEFNVSLSEMLEAAREVIPGIVENSLIPYEQLMDQAAGNEREMEDIYNKSLIEYIETQVMNNKDLKESIDNLIKEKINREFSNIEHISDATSEKLKAIQEKIVKEIKSKVILEIRAKSEGVLGYFENDPGNIIDKVVDKVWDRIAPVNGRASYFTATVEGNVSNALLSLYDKDVGEIQADLISLDSTISETSSELKAQTEELNKIKNKLKEKQNDEDLKKREKELESKVEDVSKKLKEAQTEIDNKQREEIKLTEDKKKEEERVEEHKKEAEKAWSEPAERPHLFIVKKAVLTENDSKLQEKELDGNLLSKVEGILIDQLKAVKTDFVSNNVDEAYYEYKLNDAEVRVFIIEEAFRDITVLSSVDNEIIGQVMQNFKGDLT